MCVGGSGVLVDIRGCHDIEGIALIPFARHQRCDGSLVGHACDIVGREDFFLRYAGLNAFDGFVEAFEPIFQWLGHIVGIERSVVGIAQNRLRAVAAGCDDIAGIAVDIESIEAAALPKPW